MSSGISDEICVSIVQICRVLAMMPICCVCSSDPMGVFFIMHVQYMKGKTFISRF